MNTITLDEAKQIKLFNRTETKYKCDFESACKFMQYLYDNYFVVSENGISLFNYMSVYFDTPELKLYNDHKKGVPTRQKVRIREYSNGDKYLEIKTKSEDGKTNKQRIPINHMNINANFVWVKENLKYNIQELNHILNVKYLRLTFISQDYHERITIDFNIEFFNLLNSTNKKIGDVIIEIKQDDKCQSKIKEVIKTFNIEETHFSKYYNGLTLTT